MTNGEQSRFVGVKSIPSLLVKWLSVLSDLKGCQLPPPYWKCSRTRGHEGPCAAREVIGFNITNVYKDDE